MKTFRLFLLAGLLTLTATGVYAADTKTQDQAAPQAGAAGSADKAAMMEKMKKLMSPSDAHKVLEPLAGKWTYTAKFWMDPSGKPEETTGSSENELIYGGRFLKQTVKGTWMGEPFEGAGYTGYDNIRQQYESIWMDSMSTSMMTSTGAYDAATKTLTQSGSCSCPLTGEKNRQVRSELLITDKDHNTYSSFMSGPDGKEFKAMEIVYTRA